MAFSEYLNFMKVQSKLLKIAFSCKCTPSNSHSTHCRFKNQVMTCFLQKSTNSQGKKPQHVWPLLFFFQWAKTSPQGHLVRPNLHMYTAYLVYRPIVSLLQWYVPQFYLQLLYESHFRTWILQVGPFAQYKGKFLKGRKLF